MLKIKVFNYQTGEIHPIDLTPETNSKGQCTIGRALSCDLVLVSPEVSRIHARIIYQNGDYYFTDLCSRIGSRINNRDVQANQSYTLSKNDVIRIGGFVILVESVETSSLGYSSPGWVQGSDRHWTKDELLVRCVGVVNETADIKTFSFAAEPSVPFTYQPGQFITLELEINGEPTLGSYFLSSTPSRPHSLEITVKRVGHPTDSRNRQLTLVSNWLHDRITIGSTVKLIGSPMGDFTCVDKPSQKLLMISSGSGIIPIMSMMRWVSDTLPAESDLLFFHSARSPRDIIFRQELELMAARMPKFRMAMTMTHPEPGDVWMGLTGKVTETMLQTIAPDFQERIIYVCGSDSFLQAIKAMAEALAFPMENYYEERLATPKKSQNALKSSDRKLLLLPPSDDRFQHGFQGSEQPTVIRLPLVGQQDQATVTPFNRGALQDDATVTPFNQETPQETARGHQSIKQVTATYEKGIEAIVQEHNGTQMPVEELPIPLNDMFSEARDRASKLVSNSPFSTGLPALYVIAFLSGISIGLFSPFISTFLKERNVDDLLIGANSTVYFLCVALGTPIVAKILHYLGLRRTMMLGLLLMGISAPLFPMTTEIPLWFVLRAIMGFSSCFYLVSGQTALNHFCQQSNRAVANGLYAMAFSFGFGSGPVIGSFLYKISPIFTFSLGSILILSGIIVVYVGLPERSVVIQRKSGKGILKKLTLPLQGAFAYGLTISTLVSLYPIYLLQLNFTVEQVAYTFSIFVIGGLLSTVPVTHLADRFGRLEILVSSVCIALFTLLSLSWNDNFFITQILAFIGGVSVSPIFPLSLALIGEKLSKDELSAGSAAFTSLYGCGCTAGPLVSSIIMKILDPQYIFSFCIIIFVIFGFKLITKINRMAVQV